MKTIAKRGVAVLAASLLTIPLSAVDMRIDLGTEQVGKAPMNFEPMVGTWVIAQDVKDKVVMVDGRPWVANKRQSYEASHPVGPEALWHIERRADGQREAIRVLSGRRAEGCR